MSNAPFFVVGAIGLICLCRSRLGINVVAPMRKIHIIFFAATCCVGVGSSVYHMGPTNASLVWDRLPMTIALMAFFTFMVGERISHRVARRLFLPLLALGLISVGYWFWTEHGGHGDLRLYALVQFLPMLLIPLILMLFKPVYSHDAFLWLALGAYVLAKVAEGADRWIYSALGVSGHSVKHVVAAGGAYIFLRALRKRRNLSSDRIGG